MIKGDQEGPVCVQLDSLGMPQGTEDCLKLNIYTHDVIILLKEIYPNSMPRFWVCDHLDKSYWWPSETRLGLDPRRILQTRQREWRVWNLRSWLHYGSRCCSSFNQLSIGSIWYL